MKSKITNSTIAMVASLIGVALIGQEYTPAEPIVVANDGGVNAVYEAQADPGPPPPESFVSASKQIEKFQNDRGYFYWDDEKKRFFAVGLAQTNLEDPSYDKSFFTKREILAKMAVLNGKRSIIEFINTEMSAKDQLVTPGTDVNAELGAAYDDALARIDGQREAVARLLETVDKAEAEELRGATTQDRINALLDAAIVKLGGEFDSEQIESKQRERLELAKQRYEESRSELERLEKEAASMKGEVTTTFSSSIENYAKMALMGATVIKQAESWNYDDEQYEVAVLLCWSSGLEEAARSILTGENVEVVSSNPKKLSLQEWLSNQDLASMIGPRQYLDKNGQRHFLGITARELGSNAAINRKNRGLADMYSRQMAVFSLFADVEAQRKAAQLMQERSPGDISGRSSMEVAESFAEQMTQEVQGLQVQGLGKIMGMTVRHPLTGSDVYVSVHGISPEAAKAAEALQTRAAAVAIEVNKANTKRKGRTQAINDRVEASQNDRASYQAGYQQGNSEMNAIEEERQRAREAAERERNGQQMIQSGTGSQYKQRGSEPTQSQTRSGDTLIDDDF